ncbi:MAG: carbohydrate binding domain-containing protein [Kiritimatiellia bacterium]
MSFACRFLLGLALTAPATAAELVPFSLPWDDGAPGPADLSATLHKPAGGQGFVEARDGHLFAGSKRIRFFGANVTAGACFPDHETAGKVAARMAKFGLNAVRFHFLDSAWGKPRLIQYDTGDWTRWDDDALDRFDTFFARLKERGIYSNLNLLVGRRFGVQDGVDPAIQQLDWKVAHAIGFFHAPHLEAQKAYARRLLTHRNPHTGLTYAEDPAVAMVEVNNENGLIHTWLAGDFDNLPEIFARDLQRQWNDWLARHHRDTAALIHAWGAVDEPPGAEMLKNGGFTDALRGWNLEQHKGAAVDASTENGAAILRPRGTGGEPWQVQINHRGLTIRKDQVYTVRFRIRADRERTIRVNVMQAHEPWRDLGFNTTLTVTPGEQTHSFTFIAREDDDNARFGFSDLNQAGAEFRFSDLSLRPGGRTGLAEGESLEARNLAAPRVAGTRALPAAGRQEWIQFLWDTERAHWAALRKFLKEDLGVKVPIVGTIVATSTPNLMAEFDIVDTHAYWQHPRFPGKPWDRNNWSVNNVTMADATDGGTLARLAFQRVAGKPHMVSEYNHPAPNTHAGEGPLFIAAWAAHQDWDAIFLYTYSHDDAKTKARRIPDFFDIGPHPTIMANAAAASLLFRRGDIPPAPRVRTIPLPAPVEIRHIAEAGRDWNVLPVDRLGVNLLASLEQRIALDIRATPSEPLLDSASGVCGITWNHSPEGRGLFVFRGERSKGFVGTAGATPLDLGGGVRVVVGKTRTGWCTLALTRLEGDLGTAPARALLVATGTTENTGMGWKNAEKTTVGTDWGSDPSLVEVVSAEITLPHSGSRPVVYPLDELGQRGPAVEAAAAGKNEAMVRIGPPHRTLCYEIVWP